MSRTHAVGVSFVVAVATATALGEGSTLVGSAPLAHHATGAAFLGVVLTVAVVGGWWLAGSSDIRVPLLRPGRWAIALAPSALLTSYALAARFTSAGERSAWFLGGDHLRHVVYVAEVRGSGNLSYAHETYPRGWHTLVAAVWAGSGGAGDGPGLRSLVEIMSTMTWFLPVVLAVAIAVLGATFAACCGLGAAGRALAGLVASSGVLVPSVLANYQALGFENSWVAAIACATTATDIVAARRGIRPVLVCAAGLVVISHSWQLLLPVVAVGLGRAIWRLACDHPQDRRRDWIAAATVLASGLVCWPALRAVVTQVGLEHATDSDVVAPIPVVLLGSAVASSLVLLLVVARQGRLTLTLLVVALPAATALAVGAVLGIPLTDYYPSKLLWHTAVLGLGPAAAVLVLIVRRLLRHGVTSGAMRVVGGAAAVVVGAYLAVTPVGAFVGAWSTADGDRLLRLVTTRHASAAQVAWMGEPLDDARARILLDFYRAAETRQRAPQEPLSLAEECDLLHRVGTPTVLSDRPAPQVRARYGCVPGVHVVLVMRPR